MTDLAQIPPGCTATLIGKTQFLCPDPECRTTGVGGSVVDVSRTYALWPVPDHSAEDELVLHCLCMGGVHHWMVRIHLISLTVEVERRPDVKSGLPR